jgi:hypothetical protein
VVIPGLAACSLLDKRASDDIVSLRMSTSIVYLLKCSAVIEVGVAAPILSLLAMFRC